MNTINNINTNNMNATCSTAEIQQAATSAKSNWMIGVAGLLFWAIVFCQIEFLLNDIVDKEFIDFVYYNALPLIGVLAFFGIRKEQNAASNGNDGYQQKSESDC